MGFFVWFFTLFIKGNMIIPSAEKKIVLSDVLHGKLMNKCKIFIERSQGSLSYYENKRGTNKELAKKNIVVGKKGEVIAEMVLRKYYGFPLCKVDFEIRKDKDKGWLPDLPYNEIGKDYPAVHVKTCTHFTFNYAKDFSWSFQLQNSKGVGGRDKLFDLPDTAKDLVVLVYLENENAKEGTVKAIMPWSKIKRLLRDPVRRDYRGDKLCLYYNDLI